ncbi:MAG: hypothetical protein JWO95_1565 [Verrucomicrobiales bacterium]|nr:hypothetical protein [Verrucomicrobiales bacterium]
MDLSALNISAGTLFASLIWGTIGFGFFIYGKKQSAFIPMLSGLALIGISYFIASPLYMSLVAIGILVVMWVLIKRG